MEIIQGKPTWFFLRFFIFFPLLIAIWSLFASFYGLIKMHVLQTALSWLYPTHTPFIRNPGFMQGFAIAVIIFLSLLSARWNKNNIKEFKAYPWKKSWICLGILFLLDVFSQLMEVIAQRSSAFLLNYSVTWLLSVGVIVLPFLFWLWMESSAKSAHQP